MKKVIAIFGALAITAGMSFAQNNSSDVSQVGNGHNADVEQQGSSNSSIVDQDQRFNLNLERGSDADVFQQGDDNVSELKQGGWNMVADIDQEGDENTSKINQSNGGNEAYVSQVGDRNTLKGYKAHQETAFQKSGSSLGGDIAVLNLEQVGNDNTAGVWQEHGATASIKQVGDENVSTVFQTGSAFPSVHSSAVVDVFGDRNTTDIYQKHFGAGNAAAINIGPYASNDNEVNIRQEGNSNDASFGMQKGDDNTVNLTQTGDNNLSEYSVKYGDGNEMTETVTGNSNRTRFSVDAAWGSMSSDNTVDVSKTGDGNYFSGKVEGSSNDIDVVQTGNDNRIGTSWYTKDGISIMGDMNTVDVQQLSDGNQSFNTVTGNNNTINVVQQ